MKRLFILLISLTTLFTSYSKQKASAGPSLFDKVNYTVEAGGTDPGATAEQIQERLDALNTEMDLRCTSEVQGYIEQYLKYSRKQITNLLLRSSYYMPIFEAALQKAGLPMELKYLPIIESGLNPKATSPVGAAGLWQFMTIAAKGYDMAVNASIDERRDPYISSERACRLLSDLYKRYNDWGLALAAYNAGPGTIDKALKRAGGERSEHDFWTVSSYLPRETRKYVPLFIAMTYLMNYYGEHAIPGVTVLDNLTTEAITITEKTSLKKMAPELDVAVEDLRLWNPQFKTDIVPGTEARPCNIIVPALTAMAYYEKKELDTFLEEAEVMATATNPVRERTITEKSEKGRVNESLKSDENYDNVQSKTNRNEVIRTSKHQSIQGSQTDNMNPEVRE